MNVKLKNMQNDKAFNRLSPALDKVYVRKTAKNVVSFGHQIGIFKQA